MKSQNNKSLLIFSIGFLLVDMVTNYLIIELGNGDFAGGLIKTFLFLLVIFLMAKGVKFLKWILVLGLGLYGLVCVLAGLENDYILFYLIAGYYIFFAFLIFHYKTTNGVESENKIGDAEELTVNEEESIHLEKYTFPTLIRRVQALLIDTIILFLLFLLLSTFLSDDPDFQIIKLLILVVFVLSYEPILTAYSSTIGQRVMRIQVRRKLNPEERISLPKAYIRWIVKALLGWISFITINFNPEHRAMHDLASDSVVIDNNSYSD